MKKYNFDEDISRVGTSSVKWDFVGNKFKREGLLPLWVADLDFACPQEIIEEINKRLTHPLFGYTVPSEKVKESICSWNQKQNDLLIKNEEIIFCSGVVPSLSVSILTCTEVGDGIIIQPPVYPSFFSVIEANKRKVLLNPLRQNDEGHYAIDFEQLEKILPTAKMMIICSPHNPVGRVWNQDEITKIINLCRKYDVYLISDEIHSDLIFSSYKHYSVLHVDKACLSKTIVCMAPSKTFNLAGMKLSYMIIPEARLREKIHSYLLQIGMAHEHPLSLVALEAAYSKGHLWKNEMMTYIEENYFFVKKFFSDNLPLLKVTPSQGTYLMWLDFRSFNLSEENLDLWLLDNAKVAMNDGPSFGLQGKGFRRMNLGTTRKRLLMALEAICKAHTSKYK